VAAAHPVFFGL